MSKIDVDEEISIKISIEDRSYPLRIESSQKQLILEAAKTINEKSKFYRENFSVKDLQDCLAMVALEFATTQASDLPENMGEKNELNRKIQDIQSLLIEALS